MEKEKEPRAFQELTFDDLLAIKMTSPELAHRIDYELRTRYAEFRDYCDRYDALTAEQKEIAEPCFRYRMQLGAVGVRRCVKPEITD